MAGTRRRTATSRFKVGTAGWSIPQSSAARFATTGTHLERYAREFGGVEINSSFYRSHRRETYVRWAESTPTDFSFALKLPRAITHDHRLRSSRALFEQFLAETSGLGRKRGPLLVQLPPSLTFERPAISRFFTMVRDRYSGPLVCEPRHATWFTSKVDAFFVDFTVARVAADPARASGADAPGGWTPLAYVRLHGSPRIYWSDYSHQYLQRVAATLLSSDAREVWCIFDNTAMGAATENALTTLGLVQRED